MAPTGLAGVRQGFIPRTMRPRALLLNSIERIGLERFELGVQFQPRNCTDLLVRDAVYCADETLPNPAACDPFLQQTAFHILDAFTSPTLGWTGDEIGALLQTRFDEMMSWAFAKALMGSGITYTGMTLPNQAHAPTGVGYGAGVPLAKGIQILENELAKTMHNAAGIIHVSPAMLGVVGGLTVDDPIAYTPSGHLIVADAGYFGAAAPTGQAASTPNVSEWIYASGPIQYEMSDVDRLIGAEANSYTDIGNNVITRLAQAWGLMIFDPCPVSAVLVTY